MSIAALLRRLDQSSGESQSIDEAVAELDRQAGAIAALLSAGVPIERRFLRLVSSNGQTVGARAPSREARADTTLTNAVEAAIAGLDPIHDRLV